MKNRVIKFSLIAGIVILAGLLFTIFIYKPAGYANTAQEAVTKSGRILSEIIHEEKVKGGEIIFYTHNINSGATTAAGFIKKTLWGWKWVWGGEHTGNGIGSIYREYGFSAQYLPAVKGTPFPLYYGAIFNGNIDKIKVVELQTNNSYETKISGSGEIRVWYLFADNLKGTKFAIKAYSKEGKELSSIDDDISQYILNKEL